MLLGKVQAGVGTGDGQFLFEKYVSGRPLLRGSPSVKGLEPQMEAPRKKHQCGGEAGPSA